MTAPLWLPPTRTATEFVSRPLAEVLADFEVSALPPVFEAVLDLLPDGAFIAGGFFMELLAGLDRKDIDVWFTSEEAVSSFLADLREALKEDPLVEYDFREEVNPASGVSTFIAPAKHTPISLNSSYLFTDANHIIDSFDFTVVQVAVGRDRMVRLGPTTLSDIENMRLVFHRPQNSLYYRTKRYLQKGFRPTSEAWETIAQLAPRLNHELQVFKNHATARAAFESSAAGLGESAPPEAPPAPAPASPPPEVPSVDSLPPELREFFKG